MVERTVAAAGTPGGTFTVAGPVLAEILVLVLDRGQVLLSGPCGPEPWLVEVGDDDPTSVVARMTRGNVGEPMLVHSTSWRRERNAVILTFVAVVPPAATGRLASTPVRRSELARGAATAAADDITWEQVAEHALRHLSWLAKDDAVVADAIGPEWRDTLATYVPEPFRPL